MRSCAKPCYFVPPSFLTYIAVQDMPMIMVSILHKYLRVFPKHVLTKCVLWFRKLTCSCWMSSFIYVIHFTGLSLLRPMYYEYPESSEAYTFDHQVRSSQLVVKCRDQRDIAVFFFSVHVSHTHTHSISLVLTFWLLLWLNQWTTSLKWWKRKSGYQR